MLTTVLIGGTNSYAAAHIFRALAAHARCLASHSLEKIGQSIFLKLFFFCDVVQPAEQVCCACLALAAMPAIKLARRSSRVEEWMESVTFSVASDYEDHINRLVNNSPAPDANLRCS